MTLTEILAVVGIFTVIMGAVSLFQANIFRYSRSASGSFTTIADAQNILRTMSRELRMASQGADGSYAIQSTGTSSMVFFSDLNGDGTKERVKYWLYKNSLYRTVLKPAGSPPSYPSTGESTTTLVAYVKNVPTAPIFEYYDGAYTGTSTPLSQPVATTLVRLVKINLTLDVDPNASPVPRTYTVGVTLRNLKDNL